MDCIIITIIYLPTIMYLAHFYSKVGWLCFFCGTRQTWTCPCHTIWLANIHVYARMYISIDANVSCVFISHRAFIFRYRTLPLGMFRCRTLPLGMFFICLASA